MASCPRIEALIPWLLGADGPGRGLVVDQQVEVRGVRHRFRRRSSQSSSSFIVRSSSGQTRPAMVSLRLPRSTSSSMSVPIWADPGGVHRGEGEDESRGRGGGRRDGPVDLGGDERLQHAVLVRPTFIRLVGLRKTSPFRLAQLNSERRAMSWSCRWWPCSVSM